jgi:hypothetical protein
MHPTQSLHQALCERVRRSGIVGAEFHEEKASPLRHEVEVGRALAGEAVDNRALESLEADWPVLENVRHVIGCGERVGVSQSNEGPVLRAGNQPNPGVEHDRARALGAHKRPRHVEPVLGQQLLEVVAGHPSGTIGESRADQIRVAIANCPQRRVQISTAAALTDDRVEFGVAGGPHGQLGSVVQQHAKALDVVDCLSSEQRMRAARVVANHAAEAAATVGRRIGTERQPVCFGLAPQRVEDDSGLDASRSRTWVQVQNLVHVLREVEHDGDVAALSRQAGSGTPWEHGSAVRPAHRDRGHHILGIARHDEADWHLPVIRAVGGVDGPTAGIEAHLAPHGLRQRRFERSGL